MGRKLIFQITSVVKGSNKRNKIKDTGVDFISEKLSSTTLTEIDM